MPRYCPSHHADGKDAYGRSCKGRTLKGEDGCMWTSKRKQGKWAWVRVNPESECAKGAKDVKGAKGASRRRTPSDSSSEDSDEESDEEERDVRDRKTCKSMTVAEIRDTDEFEQVPGRWKMKKAKLCDKISKLAEDDGSDSDDVSDDDELKSLDKTLKKLGIKGMKSSTDEISKVSRRLDMIMRAESKNQRQREKLEHAKRQALTLANTLTNGREAVLASIMPSACPAPAACTRPAAKPSCPKAAPAASAAIDWDRVVLQVFLRAGSGDDAHVPSKKEQDDLEDLLKLCLPNHLKFDWAVVRSGRDDMPLLTIMSDVAIPLELFKVCIDKSIKDGKFEAVDVRGEIYVTSPPWFDVK